VSDYEKLIATFLSILCLIYAVLLVDVARHSSNNDLRLISEGSR